MFFEIQFLVPMFDIFVNNLSECTPESCEVYGCTETKRANF